MQHIADRIRDGLKQRGLTVSGLAEATAIPRVTLIRRLANPASLTLGEIERIAEALGLSPVALTVTEDAA